MSRELTPKDLTAEQFRRFGDYIRDHSGIHLEETKRDPLRISLVARATRWECRSLDEYFEILSSHPKEFDELLNLITINETSFFRFPNQFEAMQRSVIPEILEHKPSVSRSFRVWSAGCSTGEEPYTIAMTLLETDLESLGFRSEVLGTDVSTQALDRARNAVYPAKALANLEAEAVNRYFERADGGYRVAPNVRRLVDFSYHNLVKEPYPLALAGNWDIIFCRNVTIYFKLESTRRVVHNFFDSLNPGGYLFIGHSETLTWVSDRFEPMEVDGVFLYRKPPLRRFHALTASADESLSRTAPRGDTMRSFGRDPRVVAATTSNDLADEQVPDGELDVVAEAEAGAAELVHDLVTEARERLVEGNPTAALALATKALDRDGRNVDAYLIVAYAHADGGDFAAALEECRRVLAINPLVAAARFILGIIYLRLDEPLRAAAEFKRTLYIDTDFVLARFHLANLYRVRGSMDEACREYENTLRSLERSPQGDWTSFMGGFTADLLARTAERGLSECRRVVASG